MTTHQLGRTGIWSNELRYGDPADVADQAAELESLGYTTLWIPDVGGDVFGALERLLRATTTATIATGILNLWMHPADETAREHARLADEYGDRFVAGIGVSHQMLIDADAPGRYAKPLAAMKSYLDQLDGAEVPLRRQDRLLAALRPKMLELARDRAAGVHTYFVTPEHTAQARAALGPEATIAPEQAVVLSTDAAQARAIGRRYAAIYLLLPNYTNNLRLFGFGDDDFAAGGSDRLIDAIVAWGDEAAIARRVQDHRDAGADHVCIQVLVAELEPPITEWRRLAPVLT